MGKSQITTGKDDALFYLPSTTKYMVILKDNNETLLRPIGQYRQTIGMNEYIAMPYYATRMAYFHHCRLLPHNGWMRQILIACGFGDEGLRWINVEPHSITPMVDLPWWKGVFTFYN